MNGPDSFDRFLEEWSRRTFLRRLGGAAAYAAFLAGGLDLAACGGEAARDVTPAAGGRLVEGVVSELHTFNPVLAGDSASHTAAAMVYDSLYMIDAAGAPVPLLAAQAPAVSADGLTYTVTLRSDARWTDGRPVTAADVKLTYDVMFDPAYRRVNSAYRAGLEEYLQAVTTPDARTVVFQLRKVYAPFAVSQLEYGILPQHVYGPLSADQINSTPLNVQPAVTSGPFVLAGWQRGQQVTFRRNAAYYRGAPHLDTYVIRLVSSSVDVLNQLRTGEIDVGPGLDPADAEAARAVPQIRLLDYTGLTFDFYLYNLDPARTALFQDRVVRQALLYALDRAAIVRSVYFGYAAVADTSMPPPSWAHNPANTPTYRFDPRKAEAMLEAAGWRRDADGVRARGDVRLSFQMLTNAGNKARENTLLAMQQMWGRIGVQATPKFVDFNAVLVPTLRNSRDFEVLLAGFQWDPDPDQAQIFHSRSAGPGGYNGMGYRSPHVDQVLDEAVGTTDRARRRQLYFELQKLLAEDVPAPVLLFPKRLVGVNRRVHGWNASTFAHEFEGRRLWIKDVFVSGGD